MMLPEGSGAWVSWVSWLGSYGWSGEGSSGGAGAPRSVRISLRAAPARLVSLLSYRKSSLGVTWGRIEGGFGGRR